MAENTNIGGTDQNQPHFPEVDILVRTLGLIFSNTLLYGLQHGVTKQATVDGYQVLCRLFKKTSEVTFDVSEDSLLVNNNNVDLKNPLMKTFVTHLMEREMTNFGLLKGMPREKFDELLEILMAKKEDLEKLGGFSQFVQDAGMEHVKARKIIYRQVSDDEMVIAKGSGATDGRRTEDQILSFLKGGSDVSDDEMSKSLHVIASDVNKLTDIIMDAAGAGGTGTAGKDGDGEGGGEGDGGSGGEEGQAKIEDSIIGCLERAYESMLKDPSTKTQKGRKEMSKTLGLLEKSLLTRLDKIGVGKGDKTALALSSAVEGMRDELAIDALASNYAKKRLAIEKGEAKILRFMKTRGLDGIESSDLKDKLAEEGLGQESWERLLMKSGVSGEMTQAEGAEGMATGYLALLVASLDEKLEAFAEHAEHAEGGEGGSGEGGGLGNVVGRVEDEMLSVVAGMDAKLDDLEQEIKKDNEAQAQGKSTGLTKTKILAILAEIVQEFCQPLSVMMCVVDGLKGGSMGEVESSQLSLLELASQSGDRLKVLIDKVSDISGMPDELSPDAEMISDFYNK